MFERADCHWDPCPDCPIAQLGAESKPQAIGALNVVELEIEERILRGYSQALLTAKIRAAVGGVEHVTESTAVLGAVHLRVTGGCRFSDTE